MKRAKKFIDILTRYKDHLKKKYHVKSMAIFGSYARGEENPSSDLDIIVTFDQPIGLDFVILADELESLLRVKVDLVSEKAVKPRMINSIKKDLLYV
jgi:predicted nucleotidyltransferase